MNIWNKTKVLVINDHSRLVYDMFKDKGCKVETTNTGDDVTAGYLELFDLIVFTGGTDISPYIYCNERDDNTDESDRDRDVFEIKLIQMSIKAGIGIVGICRGAQLLCAHLGGVLQQHDISGYHLTGHNILLNTIVLNRNVLINYAANHHQIILPPKEMDVIGYAGDHCEIAIHTSYGILAFQPHPEWETGSSVNQQAFFEMVKEYCI